MRITRRSLVASFASLSLTPQGLALAQDTPNGPLEPTNVFFSPAGRPYRAKMDAPYPVADWFKAADKNADGKIDKAEFVADSVAFFDLIDRNKDGALSPQEIAFYEQRVAPEVLGYRVELGFDGVLLQSRGPMLWRAQIHQPGPIDPGGDDHPSDVPPRKETFSEAATGAAPFSFFDEPEPLMAADLHFRGYVAKADFLTLTNAHFATLDRKNLGYLTPDVLPWTPMQRMLSRQHKRH